MVSKNLTEFGIQMNFMSPTLNIDHQHHILAYMVNFVIGLHSVARTLSRENFPYHKVVEEIPHRTVYGTRVSTRVDQFEV